MATYGDGSNPAQSNPTQSYATGIGGGALSGAAAGSAFGPYGAALGAVGGAVLGGVNAYNQQSSQANIPGYTPVDYTPTIDYLNKNFSVPSYQNYTPTSPYAGINQFSTAASKYGSTLSNILERTNDKSNAQYRHDLFSVSPTLQGNIATQGANTQSFLNGQIPTDVAVQVGNRDAETSLLGGYGGSQSARNLTARDLGLTSLDLIDKGNAGLQSQLGYSQALNPYQSNTLDYLGNPQQYETQAIGQNQYGNQVFNTNATNTSNFANQRASDIAQLMQLQAQSNSTGTNTNAYIDWQRAGASPGLAAASAGFGAISPYLAGNQSYGLQGNTNPQSYNGSNSSGWLQGLFGNTSSASPYGSSYEGAYNNLPVYRPQTV